MSRWSSCVYVGQVMHHRLVPRRHRFVYDAFTMLLDIDEMVSLDASSRLFGHNRPAPIAFHDRDHGPCDGTSLRDWAESGIRRAGLPVPGGPIRLLCLPRVLGFAFNPLTIWLCHDRDDRLAVVIYEVRNTFGERRSYLIPVSGDEDVVRQSCPKALHVSPFFPVDGSYSFRLTPPDERFNVQIRYALDGDTRLIAVQTGERRALEDGALARALARFPLMTFKVIAAIHFEALRLWFKRVPLFRHRPAAAPDIVAETGASG
ncbi:MAG: DUF1365 domain-containing protein [Rhodospirillales bacterium]|nr:DUF1365 domain-containing protein [Rhodospirillales bacterium]